MASFKYSEKLGNKMGSSMFKRAPIGNEEEMLRQELLQMINSFKITQEMLLSNNEIINQLKSENSEQAEKMLETLSDKNLSGIFDSISSRKKIDTSDAKYLVGSFSEFTKSIDGFTGAFEVNYADVLKAYRKLIEDDKIAFDLKKKYAKDLDSFLKRNGKVKSNLSGDLSKSGINGALGSIDKLSETLGKDSFKTTFKKLNENLDSSTLVQDEFKEAMNKVTKSGKTFLNAFIDNPEKYSQGVSNGAKGVMQTLFAQSPLLGALDSTFKISENIVDSTGKMLKSIASKKREEKENAPAESIDDNTKQSNKTNDHLNRLMKGITSLEASLNKDSKNRVSNSKTSNDSVKITSGKALTQLLNPSNSVINNRIAEMGKPRVPSLETMKNNKINMPKGLGDIGKGVAERIGKIPLLGKHGMKLLSFLGRGLVIAAGSMASLLVPLVGIAATLAAIKGVDWLGRKIADKILYGRDKKEVADRKRTTASLRHSTAIKDREALSKDLAKSSGYAEKLDGGKNWDVAKMDKDLPYARKGASSFLDDIGKEESFTVTGGWGTKQSKHSGKFLTQGHYAGNAISIAPKSSNWDSILEKIKKDPRVEKATVLDKGKPNQRIDIHFKKAYLDRVAEGNINLAARQSGITENQTGASNAAIIEHTADRKVMPKVERAKKDLVKAEKQKTQNVKSGDSVTNKSLQLPQKQMTIRQTGQQPVDYKMNVSDPMVTIMGLGKQFEIL